MLNAIQNVLDWFIPEETQRERAELGMARNFVFMHLFGPAMAQSISIFLYLADPHPGFACWTMIIAIWSFPVMPFVLKYTKNMRLAATFSVQILAFAALFGAYNYGGVSSPLLPWLLIALLNGFFYLSGRPWLVVGAFAADLAVFLAVYMMRGSFPERVPLSALNTVGWISIISAMIYMSWMAIYYADMIAMRSELQREVERHRATSARMHQAKELAEQANVAKSIFLAKMSHELRTPLNAVIGYSELLLEENEDTQPDNVVKIQDLKRINTAGRHLLSLVTDVLDLSAIEANTIQLTAEIFELRGFIEDVVSTVQPMIDKNGNRLSVRCEADLGTISTDPTKLRQVLLNLLSNAAKFTERGVVTLSVSRDRKVADWIDFEVTDTGIGIAEADLPKLFKEFGQVSAATSRDYGGTGIGLALSQRLSAMMGGGISVKSEVGRGSTFTVRLPAVLPALATEDDEALEAA